MIKKVVRFEPAFEPEVFLGLGARVLPISHPQLSNMRMAITSPVVAINRDGSFETVNTMYVPQGYTAPKTLQVGP